MSGGFRIDHVAANQADDDPICPWSNLDTDGDGLIVHDFLTTRLSTLMSAMCRNVTMHYASQFGLTISEWRVLSLIAHKGTMPFGQLVKESTSDKSQVSRTIRALESKNLIAIVPESEDAKKKIACTIKQDGQALYKQAIQVARRKQASVILVLSQKEREAFFHSVERLQQAIESIPHDD